MIDERITLQTTAQGIPIFVRAGNERIKVVISEDSGTRITDVEIIGDGPSLRRLGEVLIGVSKAKGYHVHLEANCETSALDVKPNEVRLTVSNIEKPAQKTRPSSPPPDWARG